MLNLFQHPLLRTAVGLRTKTRSALIRSTPRSRNKFGMTIGGDFQKVMMCMTAFADSENAIIRLNLVQHLVLCSLTFQIHGFIIVDAFEERIPKQVRDDKEREFQKVMSG